MQGPFIGSFTSDKLTEMTKDLWRCIRPKKKIKGVLIGLAFAVLVPKIEYWPLLNLVTVFLSKKELFSPLFPPCFRFSLVLAIG